MSKVLVLNAGSSSLKFKLFQLTATRLSALVGGLVERIGEGDGGRIKIEQLTADAGPSESFDRPVENHGAGLQFVLKHVRENFSANIAKEVKGVGHRVVHGLELNKAVLVDDAVRAKINEAATLAPLHNPANLSGIDAAASVFAGCPQVAVFDTAFHATMPPSAYMYALPYNLYEEHRLRRYGFHGTSYKYLVQQVATMLGKPSSAVNMIACHLGNGSSMCCIRGGEAIDTTMGVTPLEGLMMGTRCGDVDPAVVVFLAEKLALSPKQLDTLLNKKSGFLGLAGVNDVRAILKGVAENDAKCQIALDVFVHRLRKYIGAYMVHLRGQVDAIVFSAGIGENSAAIRKLAVQDLEALGVAVDDEKNAALVGKAGDFSADGSRIRLLAVPTDEELSIAQQTVEVTGITG